MVNNIFRQTRVVAQWYNTSHLPNVDALSPAITAGKGRETDRGGSKVVQHLSHLPKVQGLSPADDAGIGRDTMQTMF
jgi:hypothetical protein